LIRQFLIGLFEGDGCVVFHNDKRHNGKSIILTYDSKSQKLIEQLKILLLNFGIVTTLPYRDKRSGCYKLSITGRKNIQKFKEEIGFFSKRKNSLLARVVTINPDRMSKTDYIPFLNEYLRNNYKNSFIQQNDAQRNNFDRYNKLQKNYDQLKKILKPQDRKLIDWIIKNNFFFNKIKTVKNLNKKETVYSIKVENKCHSFIANGFINHNTEAKLSKISEEILFDIEKETVDWQPNYDSSRQEPKVLPAKLPNLLLNGSMGIAVGMATNIPPHNLSEVVDSLIYLASHPKADTEELMQFIQGPDFPTGGIIYNKKSIAEAYVSGRGPITCRANAEIEERKEGQFNIVVTEIPYQVNKAELITKIAELVQEKKIEGIRDLRDESDREGMRIVIELKNDVAPQKILNQLYKYTDLQKDFHLNMIALVDNGIQPQLLSLKEVLEAHIEHRRLVVERRAKFDLNKAKERSHILEGLSKALSVIDQIISTIKKSKDREEAFQNLIKKFGFTDIQANAILEMRLQTLAALERQKIEDELKEKRKLIDELQQLLKSPEKILSVVKDELSELKRVYGDERRTKVVAGGLKEFREEDLVPQEEVVITLSQSGYIKRVAPTVIRVQRRGGKGILGSEVSEEDFITNFISADTHDNILFFTDRGRAFQTKVYEIPAGSRISKGKVIQNFLEIPSDEKVSAIIAYATSDKGQATSGYLVMATKYGVIKKTSLEDFSNVRRSGLIAINLRKGDELKWVRLSSGKDEIILATTKGQAIRFKESQLRPMGRNASGVRAIRLKKDDFVAGLDIIKESKEQRVKSKLLVVTENGFAKQTLINQYKIQSRGGQGIKTAKIISKTGAIINAKIITNEEELLALSSKGQIIKTKISDIRTAGRATSGVRIMKLKEGDKVAGIVCL
jgi:DNA gyrase subunit A